ncbi:BOS complex subunit TMEM147-like [Procambarus clarkii]|uniref:BOS complex subunit TMEM147-like n=1 Tax=Procambarus clarkii TaxID=6728 RepID=UPI003742507E
MSPEQNQTSMMRDCNIAQRRKPPQVGLQSRDLTQLRTYIDPQQFFPQEIVKTTVDFGDVMGLSIVMGRVPGAGHIKILITGLGWAAADLLLTRALPLWVGARGLEFDWKYIQISLDANISLVHHLNMALLVWLWWRSDLAAAVRPIVAVLIAGCVYRPLLPQLLAMLLGSRPVGFALLAACATPTLCTALIASHIFITHSASFR